MKKLFWIIPFSLAALIQLVPLKRPEIIEYNPGDLIKEEAVPDNIASLLKASCYDCHSNETVYPWYSNVAPVSWLVVRDIRVGREHLNFSQWDSLSNMQKAKWISKIIDEVSEEEMPMSIYTMMHQEAKLDEGDRKVMVDWASDMGKSLFE